MRLRWVSLLSPPASGSKFELFLANDSNSLTVFGVVCGEATRNLKALPIPDAPTCDRFSADAARFALRRSTVRFSPARRSTAP
jgi:hypothetical protein